MVVGQVLAQKYRLLEQLSRGGMGSVWRAEHIELGTPAAVKLIDPSLAETEEALVRFRREAQAAASLRSANIVQILDYGVDQGIPYIAMELLRGISLAVHLVRKGTLSPLETAKILTQVGKAVAWAHSMGVVHRDLKPDNVFLANDAGETVVKLLDFGIAKTFDVSVLDGPKTTTGTMVGTPFYMSPEQAGGKRSVDFRADIWAFGVIAFECLTGKRPFSCEALGGLVLAICSEPIPAPSSLAAVPPGFDQWFARAVNRDPDERFASIRDAAQALRRVCGTELEEEPIDLLSGKGLEVVSSVAESAATDISTGPNANLSTAISTMSGAMLTQAEPRTIHWRRKFLYSAASCAFVAMSILVWRSRDPSSPIAPAPIGSPAVTSVHPATVGPPVASASIEAFPVETKEQPIASSPIEAGQTSASKSPAPKSAEAGPKPSRSEGALAKQSPTVTAPTTRGAELPKVVPPSSATSPNAPSLPQQHNLDEEVGF